MIEVYPTNYLIGHSLDRHTLCIEGSTIHTASQDKNHALKSKELTTDLRNTIMTGHGSAQGYETISKADTLYLETETVPSELETGLNCWQIFISVYLQGLKTDIVL